MSARSSLLFSADWSEVGFWGPATGQEGGGGEGEKGEEGETGLLKVGGQERHLDHRVTGQQRSH